MHTKNDDVIFTDNSRLITESLVQAGADIFVGYPITPANLLYYYSSGRFPEFMAAPDEITTVQWMAGFAAAGRIPVTATSFPGYALMIEGINMAYMMELPMVIVLVQRMGPATGSATLGAQGDIAVVAGTISGGLAMPAFSMSDTQDCWEIPAKALETAVNYRTPVVIITSKEEVMTMSGVNRNLLHNIEKIKRKQYDKSEPYLSYEPDENSVPVFLPVSQTTHQVRITASTHDRKGIIQNATKEALDNSRRLNNKITGNLNMFTFYKYDEQAGADILLLSYGITSQACCEAVQILRKEGVKVSHLITKTLLPVPEEYCDICSKYKRIFIAEENLSGNYRQMLFGFRQAPHISGINAFGEMVNPEMIIKEIKK